MNSIAGFRNGIGQPAELSDGGWRIEHRLAAREFLRAFGFLCQHGGVENRLLMVQ